MKKLILSVASLFAVTLLHAQESPGTNAATASTQVTRNRVVSNVRIAPVTSGWDRVWLSAVYTPKFRLAESLTLNEPGVDHKTTTHNYAFEAGYMLNSRLSLGLGVGYERYSLATGGVIDAVPLYLHSSYFYGKRSAGFFNYARAGAFFASGNEARTGFTGGAGVGYRLKFTRRMGVDFKLGYDYSGTRVNRDFWSNSFNGGSWSRHSLSLGVGLVF